MYIDYGNIRVCYDLSNDGYGSAIAPDFYHTITKHYNKTFESCLEWCAGPGFIGFNLLAKGTVKKISFLEIADSPVKDLRKTAESVSNVNIYQGDELNSIPAQQFDLIVSNPPHFLTEEESYIENLETRLFVDPEWSIHRNFFNQVSNYLTDDGIILLIENKLGSNKKTFESLLEGTELQITNTYETARKKYAGAPLYYLEVRKNDERREIK